MRFLYHLVMALFALAELYLLYTAFSHIKALSTIFR